MLTQTWHSLIYQVLDETHEFGVYKMYILTFGAFFWTLGERGYEV